MRTRLLIMVVIIAIVASSAVTYVLVPVKYTASFYPEWLLDNMDAAEKLRDSSIPIIGMEIDRKLAVLTIYMTDENSEKYVQEIDDLLDVPFDILSGTQSRELQCLRTYKDIREISRTHDAATSEGHVIRHQKDAVNEYVELKCPKFSDLEIMRNNLEKFSFVIIPQGAVIEGRASLNPQEITVMPGINNTIIWINEDDTGHGFVSDDGAWAIPRILKPGESYSLTFNEPGIFPYHGNPHPWITGKVIVLEE